MADITQDETIEVIVRDSATSANELKVNTDGSVNATPVSQDQIATDKVFVLSLSINAIVGGSDNPLILLKNPSGSGKTFRLLDIYAGCVVNNVGVEYKLFYAPTITLNGTATTPRNALIGSATASVAQAFTLPTLAVIGTQIGGWTNAQNTVFAHARGETLPFLQANQNLVLSAAPSSNNRAITVTLVWAEV